MNGKKKYSKGKKRQRRIFYEKIHCNKNKEWRNLFISIIDKAEIKIINEILAVLMKNQGINDYIQEYKVADMCERVEWISLLVNEIDIHLKINFKWFTTIINAIDVYETSIVEYVIFPLINQCCKKS